MVSTLTSSAVSFASGRAFVLPATSGVAAFAAITGAVSVPAATNHPVQGLSWTDGSVCIADMGGATVESMAPKTAPKTAHVSAYATRQRLAKKASPPRGRLR